MVRGAQNVHQIHRLKVGREYVGMRVNTAASSPASVGSRPVRIPLCCVRCQIARQSLAHISHRSDCGVQRLRSFGQTQFTRADLTSLLEELNSPNDMQLR